MDMREKKELTNSLTILNWFEAKSEQWVSSLDGEAQARNNSIPLTHWLAGAQSLWNRHELTGFVCLPCGSFTKTRFPLLRLKIVNKDATQSDILNVPTLWTNGW